jgi:hypothetical protein
MLTKAFAFGRAVMAKRKKKKHDKSREAADDLQS